MKKTIKLLYLSLCCITTLSEAQNNVVIEPTYSAIGHYPCTSTSGHLCGIAIKIVEPIENKEAIEKVVTPHHFLKSESGRLIMQISKATLTEEQERLNYKNKFSFFIDEDFTLDENIRIKLFPDDNKPIIIKKGMYPIVEWSDYYYIRF